MKILLADDHVAIRLLTKRILSTEFPSAHIVEVNNGYELVKETGDGRWDVVITDISMPVMTGLEAILEIRKNFKTLPILVLSSHTENEYIQYALKIGASGYVHKFMMIEDLGSAVRKAIGMRCHEPAGCPK